MAYRLLSTVLPLRNFQLFLNNDSLVKARKDWKTVDMQIIARSAKYKFESGCLSDTETPRTSCIADTDTVKLTYKQKIALSSVSEILSSCYQKLNNPIYRSLERKKQHT